ncbi:phage major capsid protein [Brevundimonas sp. 3P9-tot-E]|uniref:phage major capsid protein n=1 Tax=unclassified Brevundimonas TaxID=2622653 RepID=UPI0039A149ED
MNLTLETKNAPEPDDDGEVKAALDDLTKAANEKAAENKAAVDAEIKALRGEIAALKRPGAQTDDEPSEEAKAFGSYLRQADRSPEIKTLTVSSDPQGGYLAPAEFGTEFLKDLIELSPLRALASIRSISSSSVTYPTRIGITNATWHGETEERTESEPAFGQKEVHSRQISTWVPISNQLLADSGGTVEAEVRAALADDFAQKEGVAYLLGDGQLQPEGLLVNKDVAVVKTGHASTLGSAPADMLISFIYGLPATYRNHGTWLMNGTTLAALRKLKDGQGAYIWQASLAAGQPETILGRPVQEDPFMPDIGAGQEPIAFGDFNTAYRIVDRLALSILVDPYTQATKGITRFHATRRTGGRVLVPAAIRKIRVAA